MKLNQVKKKLKALNRQSWDWHSGLLAASPGLPLPSIHQTASPAPSPNLLIRIWQFSHALEPKGHWLYDLSSNFCSGPPKIPKKKPEVLWSSMWASLGCHSDHIPRTLFLSLMVSQPRPPPYWNMPSILLPPSLCSECPSPDVPIAYSQSISSLVSPCQHHLSREAHPAHICQSMTLPPSPHPLAQLYLLPQDSLLLHSVLC